MLIIQLILVKEMLYYASRECLHKIFLLYALRHIQFQLEVFESYFKLKVGKQRKIEKWKKFPQNNLK